MFYQMAPVQVVFPDKVVFLRNILFSIVLKLHVGTSCSTLSAQTESATHRLSWHEMRLASIEPLFWGVIMTETFTVEEPNGSKRNGEEHT